MLATYVAAILVVFLIPVPASAAPGGQFDKLVHLALFLGLALLIVWRADPGRPHRVSLAFGVSVMLAGVIEVLQAVLPYRSGDVVDFAAGALGAGVGALLGRWMASGPSAV